MIQTEAKDSINMTKVSTQEGAKEIAMAEAVTTIEDKDEAMHMDMDADWYGWRDELWIEG